MPLEGAARTRLAAQRDVRPLWIDLHTSTAAGARMARMRSVDVLDDLLAAGEVVVDEHSRAMCSHCGIVLGPVAAVGLIVRRAIAHMFDDDTTRNPLA